MFSVIWHEQWQCRTVQETRRVTGVLNDRGRAAVVSLEMTHSSSVELSALLEQIPGALGELVESCVRLWRGLFDTKCNELELNVSQ